MHIPGAIIYCPGVFSSDWLKVCTGNYTQALEDKYLSFDISKNDRYTIYRLSYAPKIYLIIFGSELFDHCIGVNVVNSKAINCTYTNGVQRSFSFFRPYIECIDNTFAFTGDLFTSCTTAGTINNTLLPRTNPMLENDYTGLIFPGVLQEFAMNKTRNKGTTIDQNIWLLAFVAVFTLIAIFRRIFLLK